MSRIKAWALLVISLLAPAPALATLVITSVSQTPFALSSGSTTAAELSGITFAGGTQYYTVADSGSSLGLYPLTINLNLTTGAITTATLSNRINVAGGDLEGVAYNAAHSSVYISDETGSNIREHLVSNGNLLNTLTIPSIFSHTRDNQSLESLTLGNNGTLWTANEEAIGGYSGVPNGDGPTSTFGAAGGTYVRLQAFNSSLAPAGQWAYLTDPITADSPFTTSERSGVSDLLALPNGQLLVLERELGGSPIPTFRNRIYLVDFTSATDTSNIAGLAGATFTPLAKTQLWEGNFASDNFEGMALGPTLSDGSMSIILISDNGNGLNQSLLALKITGVPEPTLLTPAVLMGLALRRRRPHPPRRAV